MWQVFVREATYLKDVECVWTIPNGTSLWVRGSMRIPWMWDINEPASGAALMLQCPVDKQWEEMMSLGPHQAKDPHFHHITVAIHLNIEGSASGLDLPLIRLRDYQPPPKTAVGMCTAPIYGDYKPDEWIDWREHHKLLGFEPVHWYSRDFVLGDFLQDYSTFNSSGDTYRHAPPVNPEVYDTELLSNSGLYSDQVVLAMDCMLRSKYVGPSEWLAFFDMDEYFLPDPMPTTREKRATSAADFLAKFGSHVPSVSLGRTHKADNARLDLAARNNEELRMFPRMSALALIRDPHKEDPRELIRWLTMLYSKANLTLVGSLTAGNHKHMHRVSAVEATSVHAPTELYPGHIYTPPIVPAPVRLVHLGSSIVSAQIQECPVQISSVRGSPRSHKLSLFLHMSVCRCRQTSTILVLTDTSTPPRRSTTFALSFTALSSRRTWNGKRRPSSMPDPEVFGGSFSA